MKKPIIIFVSISLLFLFLNKKQTVESHYNFQIKTNMGGAVAMIDKNQHIHAWGNSHYGGNSHNLPNKKFKKILAGNRSFVVQDIEDYVYAFGKGKDGGHINKTFKAKTIVKNLMNISFAAIDYNNSVHAWGRTRAGGSIEDVIPSLNNIDMIYPGYNTFIAINNKKEPIIWGHHQEIYNKHNLYYKKHNIKIKNVISTDKFILLQTINDKLYISNEFKQKPILIDNENHKIKKIISNKFTILILNTDGTVLSIGNSYKGGNLRNIESLLVNVKEIYPLQFGGFVAETANDIIIWGGGVSKIIKNKKILKIKSNNLTGIILLNDNTIITLNENENQEFYIKMDKKENHDIKDIYINDFGYVIINKNNEAIIWGFDFIATKSKIKNIKLVFPNLAAFGFITLDNKVKVLGNKETNGLINIYKFTNKREDFINTDELIKNKKIIKLIPGPNIFIAIDSVGRLYPWGDSRNGSLYPDFPKKVLQLYNF